jgi:hypothetical protein
VVAHSYGGAPVTEAVTTGSGVAHLVYVSAFQLDVGESLLGLMGGQAQPWYEEHDTHLAVTTPGPIFYNGVSPELTASSVAALRLQSRSSFEQPLSNAAWREELPVPEPSAGTRSPVADLAVRVSCPHSPGDPRHDPPQDRNVHLPVAATAAGATATWTKKLSMSGPPLTVGLICG